MLKPLPLLVGAILLVATGVVHGLRTDRWSVSNSLQETAKRVELLPETIGDWQGKDLPADENSLRIAQVVGHVYRTYVNRITAEEINIMLICGRPGAIGAHTPEVCYPGAGFMQTEKTRTETIAFKEGEPGEFKVATFTKGGVVPDSIRIFWAWSTGGSWRAPDAPRVIYAYHPALFKLYVISRVRDPKKPEQAETTAKEFMEVFIPELNRCLSGQAN